MTIGPSGVSRFSRFLASLVPAVVLFALFGGVVALVVSAIPSLTGVLVGAAAGGCLVLGILLAYRNAVDRNNLKIIRRPAIEGQADWTDGAVVAVEGAVRVDGEPMVSPFTATPCAAYTYVVWTGRRSSISDRDVRVVLAQGFHMIRSRIDGAGRSLRLLALPGVDDDLRRTESGTAWGDAARQLFASLVGKASREREDVIMAGLLEARNVGTEEIRRDYCMGSIGTHADGIMVEEEVLPVDRTVCIIGTYDRERNGLSAQRSRAGHNLMVYPGSASEVLARIGGDIKTFTRVAGVLVTIGLATVAYALVQRGGDAPVAADATLADGSPDSALAEPGDPVDAYLAQVDAGARREFAAGNAARALALAVDADAAATIRWLIAQGVPPETPLAPSGGTHTIALVEASRLGHLATVEALLDGGADPNAAEPQVPGATSARTALGEALGRGHCEVAARLEQSGARRPAGSEACRQSP